MGSGRLSGGESPSRCPTHIGRVGPCCASPLGRPPPPGRSQMAGVSLPRDVAGCKRCLWALGCNRMRPPTSTLHKFTRRVAEVVCEQLCRAGRAMERLLERRAVAGPLSDLLCCGGASTCFVQRSKTPSPLCVSGASASVGEQPPGALQSCATHHTASSQVSPFPALHRHRSNLCGWMTTHACHAHVNHIASH